MLMNKDAPAASNEIPTSSMADIAFLLLVFFIVTTSMNQDLGIGMTLPPPGDPLPLPKENIASVWINDQNNIALKVEGRDFEPIQMSQLRSRIERRIVANPLLVVSILATPKASYETFIDVLDELRLAGDPHDWSKISIAQPFGSSGGQ